MLSSECNAISLSHVHHTETTNIFTIRTKRKNTESIRKGKCHHIQNYRRVIMGDLQRENVTCSVCVCVCVCVCSCYWPILTYLSVFLFYFSQWLLGETLLLQPTNQKPEDQPPSPGTIWRHIHYKRSQGQRKYKRSRRKGSLEDLW